MSYYDNNWFKGSRVLFQECIDNGTPWDFFIMDIILHRVRYNGNQGNLAIGECFIGISEIGKLVGKDYKTTQRSIARLVFKSLIEARSEPHFGTKIKVVLHSAFTNMSQHAATTKPTSGVINLDKTRQEENIFPLFSTGQVYLIKEGYPKRLGSSTWNKGFEKLQKQKADPDLFLKACHNYKAQCEISGSIGTQFVKNFETFCTKGNWEEFVDLKIESNSKPGWD